MVNIYSGSSPNWLMISKGFKGSRGQGFRKLYFWLYLEKEPKDFRSAEHVEKIQP
jgi:hypothetical protein